MRLRAVNRANGPVHAVRFQRAFRKAAFSLVLFFKRKRDGVHAKSLAGRLRTVIEKMTEVRSTARTAHFRADHAVTIIGAQLDGVLGKRLEETGPAGT